MFHRNGRLVLPVVGTKKFSALNFSLRAKYQAWPWKLEVPDLVCTMNMAPPTINLADPDDDAGLSISAQPQPLRARADGPMAVINNSFGFGGANVALAFTGA